jgi:hypothetical protein
MEEALGQPGVKTIFVIGTYQVSQAITIDHSLTIYDYDAGTTFVRASGYKGVLLKVAFGATLTLPKASSTDGTANPVVIDGSLLIAKEPALELQGTLDFKGGTIKDNLNLDPQGKGLGGAILIDAPTKQNHPQLILEGGTISSNQALVNGGGIYTYDYSCLSLKAPTTFKANLSGSFYPQIALPQGLGTWHKDDISSTTTSDDLAQTQRSELTTPAAFALVRAGKSPAFSSLDDSVKVFSGFDINAPVYLTTYTISYDGNGSDAGLPAADAAASGSVYGFGDLSSPYPAYTYVQGWNCFLRDQGSLASTDDDFAGWNPDLAQATSGIATYAWKQGLGCVPSSFKVTSDTTLYAVWTPAPPVTLLQAATAPIARLLGSAQQDGTTMTVYSWGEFQAAYKNAAITKIILDGTNATDNPNGAATNTISRANSTDGTAVLSVSGMLNRSLEVTSIDPDNPVTLDFGAAGTYTNAFELATATAGAGRVLNIHDLIFSHAGTAYDNSIINTGATTTVANTAGWTVKLTNISSKGAIAGNTGSDFNGSALMNCQMAAGTYNVESGTSAGNGVAVELGGNVTWHTNNDYLTFSAGALSIDAGAHIDMETSSLNDADGSAMDMNGPVSLGQGATLTIKNFSTTTGATSFVGLLCSSFTAADQDSLPSTPNITFSQNCGHGLMCTGPISVGTNNNLDFAIGYDAINSTGALTLGANTQMTSTGGTMGITSKDAITFDQGVHCDITASTTAIKSTGASSGMTVRDGAVVNIHDDTTSATNVGISLDNTGTTTASHPGYLTIGNNVTLNIFTDAKQITPPTGGDFSTIACSGYFSGDGIDAGGISLGTDCDLSVYAGMNAVASAAIDLWHLTGNTSTGADATGQAIPYNTYFIPGAGSTIDIYDYENIALALDDPDKGATAVATGAKVKLDLEDVTFNAIVNGTTGRDNLVSPTDAVVLVDGGDGSAPTTFAAGTQARLLSRGCARGLVQNVFGQDYLNVDGASTRVDIQSSYGVGGEATVQFTIPEGESDGITHDHNIQFNVSNGARLNVQHLNTNNSGNDAPAILFENGGTFTVSGGSALYVYHAGGTDHSGNSNQAIEFWQGYPAQNFPSPIPGSFILKDKGSSATLIAATGTALTSEGNKLTISMGAGTSFVADGHTYTAGQAVFSTDDQGAAAGPLVFTATDPLYFDFANAGSNGTIFDCNANSTFEMQTSDLSVWANSKAPASGTDWGDATHTWYGLNELQLSGLDLVTLTKAPSSPSDFQTVFGDISRYGRMNANNNSPSLNSTVLPLTNADTYARWLGTVNEYPDADGVLTTRGFQTGEVTATIDYTHNGSTTQVSATSVDADNYQDQPLATALDGVLRYGDGSTLLTVGDSYKIDSFSSGNGAHPGVFGTALAADDNHGSVTVTDALPPLPASFDTVIDPTTGATLTTLPANAARITGTWSSNTIKDGGDQPAAIYYQFTHKNSVGTYVTDALKLATNPTITADGHWSCDAPANMAEGDSVQVFFADSGADTAQNQTPLMGSATSDSTATPIQLVNAAGTTVDVEPAVDVDFHDTVIPAAASIKVGKMISYVGFDIEPKTGVSTNELTNQLTITPTADTNYTISTDTTWPTGVTQTGSDPLYGGLDANDHSIVIASSAYKTTLRFTGNVSCQPRTDSATAGITLGGDVGTASGDGATAVIQTDSGVTLKAIGSGGPGISVPLNCNLTLQGDGMVVASGASGAACIGSPENVEAGNITINAGTIVGYYHGNSDDLTNGAGAVFGAGTVDSNQFALPTGTLTVNGGSVIAYTDSSAPMTYHVSVDTLSITGGSLLCAGPGATTAPRFMTMNYDSGYPPQDAAGNPLYPTYVPSSLGTSGTVNVPNGVQSGTNYTAPLHDLAAVLRSATGDSSLTAADGLAACLWLPGQAKTSTTPTGSDYGGYTYQAYTGIDITDGGATTQSALIANVDANLLSYGPSSNTGTALANNTNIVQATSLTLSGGSALVDFKPTLNDLKHGNLLVKGSNFSVRTNIASGYLARIYMASNQSTALTGPSGSIPGISSDTIITDNTWAYLLNQGAQPDGSTTWWQPTLAATQAHTLVHEGLALGSTDSPTQGLSLWYGLRADNNQAAGDFAGTTVLTVAPNL